MIKTLTKHGNSLALVIENPVLELLGADADTPFEISTDGQVLILALVKDAGITRGAEVSHHDQQFSFWLFRAVSWLFLGSPSFTRRVFAE